jgi:hypothetical protein
MYYQINVSHYCLLLYSMLNLIESQPSFHKILVALENYCFVKNWVQLF